jgi:hypothetical protein
MLRRNWRRLHRRKSVVLASFSGIRKVPRSGHDLRFLGSTSGPVSFASTLSDSTGRSMDVTASTSSAAGILRASASYTLSGPTTFFSQFQAEARADDILPINAGSLNGAIGLLGADTRRGRHYHHISAGLMVILWKDSVARRWIFSLVMPALCSL